MARSETSGARRPLSEGAPAAAVPRVAAKVVGRPARAKRASTTDVVKQAAKGAVKKAAKVVAKVAGAAKPKAGKQPGRGARRAKAPTRDYAAEVWRRLAIHHPDAHCELDHRNAFELLCATILSAQCTDKRVNIVTPSLFAAYPDARALADARQEDVEAIVKTTGFFRAKSKSLIAMARALVDRHGGAVPADMAALVVLPGVGRKTANVILGNAFAINDGVTVDTHVARLSARLGLSREEDPVRIEQDLMRLFPRDEWALLSHRLIFHGRRICVARQPRCFACGLADLCPSSAVPASQAPQVAAAALADASTTAATP